MLKIGWSSKDVSTNKPVVLPGQFHMRISHGCLDSLNICALVIEDGNDIAIFLQGDIIYAPTGLIDEIREKVKLLNNAIDISKIFINATHTHCSPILNESEELDWWGMMSDFPCGDVEIEPPCKYRSFFTDRAAEAVLEAYKSRAEGSFSYGYGYAVVAHSRRCVYTEDMSVVDMQRSGMLKQSDNTYLDTNQPNGYAKMYGNTNDEYFSHYEAGADHLANFMFTFDKNEVLTGAIINIPCPSQNSEGEEYLTSDYWNEVRTMLKEKYGDIYVMAQCAAAGDLAPRIMHYKEAQSRRFRLKFDDYMPDARVSASALYARRDIAQRICNAFDEVYSWACKEKYTEAKVSHTVKTVLLDRRMVSDEEYSKIKAENEKYINDSAFAKKEPLKDNFRANTRMLAEYHRRDRVLKRYELQKINPYEKAEIHTIRIGDIAFATNPFELYMDYQHRIQARSPFLQTFIVQLCSQPSGYVYSGYLPTERGAKNKGYSASVFCNQVSPSGGAQLVEETIEELKKLAD